jgi:preprotein translocase subunit SecA
LERIYNGDFNFIINGDDKQEILDLINKETINLYRKKENIYGELLLRQVEKRVFLMTIDKYWKAHLRNLDALRQGIGYRAYAQKDPLLEYKREAFELFEYLLYSMNEEILSRLYHIIISGDGIQDPLKNPLASAPTFNIEPINEEKIPRNAPCPCGSGKKYKQCCGKNL